MAYSSDFDKQIKQLLIDGMDGLDSDTPAVRVAFARVRFYNEMDRMITTRGELSAAVYWLKSIALNVPFADHEILKLLAPGYTTRQADDFLENWWNLLANKLLQLFRHQAEYVNKHFTID